MVLEEDQRAGNEQAPPVRSFTCRAIMLGLLGAAIAAAITPLNDEMLDQTKFIGHQLALFPFCFLLLLAWVWNPLCGKWFPRLVLRSRELVVTLGMTLCASWAVGNGLYRFFFTQLILPWTQAPGEKQWQKYDMLGYLPQHMFPLGTELTHDKGEGAQALYAHPRYESVYDHFVSGSGSVPWDVWIPILLAWLPLVAVVAIALISMALIVHRQWSRNEQLAYPLATIGRSLLECEDGHARPKLFSSRLFWAAGLFVLGLQMIRLWHHWYPSAVPDVPLDAHFNFVWHLVPNASQAGVQFTHRFSFYFLLFAIAYFVSSEIALTLGLSQLILLFVGVEFYIQTGTKINRFSDMGNMRAGAYVMYGIAILYIGRYYYWGLAKRAFGAWRPEEDQTFSADGILAARVFLLAALTLWALLVWQFELDWLIALLLVLMVLGMFLVFARIICEIGMPYMLANWSPGLVLGNLLGPTAMGAGPMIIAYYLSTFLAQDLRTNLMPFANTSFHIADSYRLKLRKLAMVALVAIGVALVVGAGVRLHKNYSYGAAGLYGDDYSVESVPQKAFNEASNAFVHLDEVGRLHDSPHGLAKLGEWDPDPRASGFFIAGLIGVALFFAMRLRFTWFPLHPVLFLVWGAWPMEKGFWSFLIGWCCKELVVRFGGGRVYQDLKPLFLGLIVGDLVAAMVGIAVGFLSFWWTGQVPEAFSTFIS